MKKKIISLCLIIALAATAVIGGTLAYFTDTDDADNVFTSGTVEIELEENFDPDNAKLLPATGSAADNTLQNAVTKEVDVKNIGTEDAFVRVHIAVPQLLDEGDDSLDAGSDVVHLHHSDASVASGMWAWADSTYAVEIDGIMYNVYVVTYGTALSAEETTAEHAIDLVYMDGKVTSDDMDILVDALGDEWNIKVVAEGAQAAGFADAETALNTAFGEPSATNNPWA